MSDCETVFFYWLVVNTNYRLYSPTGTAQQYCLALVLAVSDRVQFDIYHSISLSSSFISKQK